MLEVNQESSDTIICILDVLKKAAYSDYNFEIPINLLSPSIFLNLRHRDIENWADVVVSKLFEQTIISESHNKISGKEVEDILKERNEILYDREYLFAQDTYYSKSEEEEVEYGGYLGTEDEYIESHFCDLEIGEIIFKSSLFTSDFKCEIYKKYIPLYVMSKYNLEYKALISASFDDDLNFTIWYLDSEVGEFKEDVIYPSTTLDVYRSFANIFLDKK